MRLRHESGGRSIEVNDEQVPNYESQGWHKVAPKPTPAPKSDDK